MPTKHDRQDGICLFKQHASSQVIHSLEYRVTEPCPTMICLPMSQEQCTWLTVCTPKEWAIYLQEPETGNLSDTAHTGQDILLIPQPSSSLADPLVSTEIPRKPYTYTANIVTQNWSKYKKYWSLFLISFYACVNSFGENNWGAAWTTISADTGVTLTDMNGGSALNYLLLGCVNILWIPTAMKFGRKIVFILSLVFVMAAGIWGKFFTGTAQYYVMEVVSGIGTSAYQALIQLSVGLFSCLLHIILHSLLMFIDLRHVLRA